MNPIQPKDSSEAASASRVPFTNIPDHELIREIGRGSYGEVWLARNALGTYRAVKIVYRQTFAHDRPYEREFSGIQKFEPISRAHEGLVDILQVGRNNEAGHFYYVMELADDARADRLKAELQTYIPRTLAHEVSARGHLPVEECIELGLAMTSALAYLHKQGLIHRDIKPSNVIFVNGTPKLADIGLVTEIDATRSYVGTEGFIPPEGPGSPQSDIYSLGKVLYEISTGKDRQDYPELPTKLEETASSAGLLELNEVIIKACRAKPRDRYQSAEKMHADLLLLHAGRTDKHVRKLERRLVMTTRVGIAAGILALLAVSGWFGSIKQIRRAQRAEQQARESLREAYVAQAQANRVSGRPGRRFQSLEVLKKAAAIQPRLDLRNEAIAAMALVDIRLVREKRFKLGSEKASLDATIQHYCVADHKGNIRIRRVADDRDMMQISQPTIRPNSHVNFSPDGQLIAVSLSNHMTRVFNRTNGSLILELPGSLRLFLPDGRRLLAFEPNATNFGFGIYNLESRQKIKSCSTELVKPSFNPRYFSFHPNGDKLAMSDGQTSDVVVVNVESGDLHQVLKHPSRVFGLAWHCDGKHLATACEDYVIYIWDTTIGQQVSALEGHQNTPISVAFVHSGDLLASSAWDGTMRLWDFRSRKQLMSINFAGYVQFSSDDRSLGCRPWDLDGIKVFEVATGQELRTLAEGTAQTGQTSGLDFSFDGAFLGYNTLNETHIFDAKRGERIACMPKSAGNHFFFFDRDDNFYTGDRNGIECWPIRGSMLAGDVTVGPPQRFGPSRSYGGFAIDSRGLMIAAAGSDYCYLFDVRTGVEGLRIGPQPAMRHLAISSNRKWIATGSWNREGVSVWDAQKGILERKLSTGISPIVAFSPDNRWLLAGTGREYKLWQVGSWTEGPTFARPGEMAVSGAAFSKEGTILAVAHSSGSVKLLKTSNWKELATLELPELLGISKFCFSPDATMLAVARSTRSLQVWDLRLIRKQLATMGLDWDMPPYPPETLRAAQKPRVTVKLQ